ncbi:PBECR2 nuclease fold domain-containing protein [Perlabentimonas gracilis]|uniref:PBECR2 nuclease fold domain-containing protein n=1 Tax=Perlabentimonas gracilis TaxID=2715279 RepID=UPI00140DF11C|nr:PBECR2 nuclease fold domain-containing protein [Perlabentimonas gracilis]NHB70381.1 hypothetical protein [Perlabentimonas gracilis]
MIIANSEDGNLVFKDYQNRKITILHEEYLELMGSEERREIRSALEDCLTNPSEVWFSLENIDGKDYSYYKYIKLYSNLVFIAYVLLNEFLKMKLNNFYGFSMDDIEEAEKERCGQLIFSTLK